MPSGEVRLIDVRCRATIGQVGNVDHENEVVGKAGKSRWRGIRPSVRGMTMNPLTILTAAAEGRSGAGGNRRPHGAKPALGYRTRHNKSTDRMIVRRRDKLTWVARSRKDRSAIDHLLKKVQQLNMCARSGSSRPGRVAATSSRRWSSTQSRCTTTQARSVLITRRWSATSSVSSLTRAAIAAWAHTERSTALK